MKTSDNGGLAYGETIRDALGELEPKGYTGQFRVENEKAVECLTCEKISPPEEVRLDVIYRIEGTSDPADEVAVAALQCPRCEQKGTLILTYGIGAPAAEAKVLRHLQDSAEHAPEWDLS